MFAGRSWPPLGEGEGQFWYCRTKTPCLQEGAGCPWEKEKEKVICGNAGLNSMFAGRSWLPFGRRSGLVIGSAGLKFHVCRKELATPGRRRRRRSSVVVQD
jgi:hypothetical protein